MACVCPFGYEDPGKSFDRCFKFEKKPKMFAAARSACVNEGGDLASYRTVQEKVRFIVNQPSPELKPLMAFFVNATLCDLNYSLYQRGTDRGGYLLEI